MKLELIVKLDFKATHSLDENEAPHEHQWRVEVLLSGTPHQGRVISLPLAVQIFSERLDKIRGHYLNTCSHLDDSTRAIPTCENLAFYLLKEFQTALAGEQKRNPSLEIKRIEIGVNETADKELGAARLTV